MDNFLTQLDDGQKEFSFTVEDEDAAYRDMSLAMLVDVLRNRVDWLEAVKTNAHRDDGTHEWVGMLATCLLTVREELAAFCESQLAKEGAAS